MQSSNPVLGRLGRVANHERTATYGAGIHTQPQWGGGPYGQPTGYDQPSPYTPGYGAPATTGRAMTLDDVVTRTVLLIAITGVFGAAAWLLLPDGGAAGLAMFGSSIAGLVLGLVIAFARITNPVLISLYAAVQGVLLGVVSRYFEAAFTGIVVQAVIGTFGVFAAMAVLYRMRVLRATPRFTRFVLGALIGVVLLSMVNWIAYLFGANMGLVDYSTTGQVNGLAIVFALVCIGVGALTFILDFDAVEQGVRYGLPEKYSWYCAFGLLVGLIFLYWQILRLLSYLRR